MQHHSSKDSNRLSHLALVEDQTKPDISKSSGLDLSAKQVDGEHDQALMRQCQQGSQTAYRQLVQRNMAPVYNLLLQMTSDTTLSEDLTQETFIKVWRFANRYNPSRPFRPWLLQIAVNTLRSSKRKAQLNLQSLDTLMSEEQWLEPSSESQGGTADTVSKVTNPETLASQKETWRETLAALTELADNQRQAMVLRYQFDLPYDDIATTLNVPINTVRTWLKRGRDKLSKVLQSQALEHDLHQSLKDKTS